MRLSPLSLSVISLSQAAVSRIREIVTHAPTPALGLRVGVKKGGCAGMSYTFALAHEHQKGDEIIEQDGVKVFIEPTAVLFLIGSRLDFVSNKLSAQFVFENPNQTSACGCGESVSLTPAHV
jgi:iron-sulfur cluster assembly protein